MSDESLVEGRPGEEVNRQFNVGVVGYFATLAGIGEYLSHRLAAPLCEPDVHFAQRWFLFCGVDEGGHQPGEGFLAEHGLLHRHLLTLAAFTTGILLICDAWFDIMTSGPNDMWVAVLTAVLGELPLAAILIGGTLRMLRLTLTRLLLLDPAMPSWRLPLSAYADTQQAS